MEDLFEVLTNEEKSFKDFPMWVYAIVFPLALCVLLAIAGWMDTLV